MGGAAKKTAAKGAARGNRVADGEAPARGNGAVRRGAGGEAPASTRRVSSVPPVVERVLGDWGFTVERFVECFDVLVGAAGGTKRLKDLVLNLAVSGRLGLDRNGTPATEVGDISSGQPFALPTGWVWMPLGDIATLVDYGTSQKAHSEPTGIPVLRMNNIQDGRLDLDTLKYVPKTTEGLPGLLLREGDLLFNRTNSYELVGKMAVFRDSSTYTFASYLIRVRVGATTLPEYVNCYFGSSLCRQTQIEPNITKQTNQANFNGTKLKAVLVPLPPLAEQKRIVARVDQLMALIDELEAKQTREREVGARFTQASLEALTNAEGPEEFDAAWKRVVENWETVLDGAGSIELLKRHIVRLGTLGRFYATVETGACQTKTVADVADCLDHMRKPIRKDLRGGDNPATSFPYYGANGQVGWINSFIFDEPLVCVVEDETFVGRVKPFAYRITGKSWVNNHAHVLRARSGMDTDYLHYALAFYPFDDVASGTTGRKKLTKAELLRTPVRVPPLPQQQASVTSIRRLLHLCDELESGRLRANERARCLAYSGTQDLLST